MVVLACLFDFVSQAAEGEYRSKLEHEGRAQYAQKFIVPIGDRLTSQDPLGVDEFAALRGRFGLSGRLGHPRAMPLNK